MSKPCLALALATTLLASCSATSNDQSAMALLKAGDAKLCVAGDVEDALRALIMPKGQDAKGYTISFADATLETFDKVVSKATCHANLRIGVGSDDLVPSTGIDFTVVPSAQHPDTFVVAAAVAPYQEQLANALAYEAAHQEQARQRDEHASKLAATVKPGWLIGRWVPNNQGSDACAQGPYYHFAKRGRWGNEGGAGRWQLANQDLSIIGTGAAITQSIVEADANSMTLDDSQGQQVAYRRCTQADMAAAQAEADEVDYDEKEDTSGIEAQNTLNN